MPISKMSVMGKNRTEHGLPSSIPSVWGIARHGRDGVADVSRRK